MLFVPADALRSMSEKIFQAAGSRPAIAASLSDALILANLVGHDSHGVMRIPAYITMIKSNRVGANVEPTIVVDKGATVLVDGNEGFGQLAGRLATDQAVAKAKAFGAAAVGVINCNHVGRLGEYPERAARQGVILFVTCGSVGNAGSVVAPFGGSKGILGTNPISVGMPAGQRAPMIVDFATTVVAGGKVEVARDKGVDLPPGAILDKHGKPSVNPHDVRDGGVMLTFGGHKGFGLAMVASVLAQGVTGEMTKGGGPSRMGFFLWAVDTGAFTPAADYGQRVDWMIDQVKAVPPAEGFKEVLVPGEPERAERQRREANGVPIPEPTWASITKTATELGIPDAMPKV